MTKVFNKHFFKFYFYAILSIGCASIVFVFPGWISILEAQNYSIDIPCLEKDGGFYKTKLQEYAPSAQEITELGDSDSQGISFWEMTDWIRTDKTPTCGIWDNKTFNFSYPCMGNFAFHRDIGSSYFLGFYWKQTSNSNPPTVTNLKVSATTVEVGKSVTVSFGSDNPNKNVNECHVSVSGVVIDSFAPDNTGSCKTTISFFSAGDKPIIAGVADSCGNRVDAQPIIVAVTNAATPLTWYKDSDNDEYSDGTTKTSATRPGNDYYLASELRAISGDCNDNDPNKLPKDCALDSSTLVGSWEFVGVYGTDYKKNGITTFQADGKFESATINFIQAVEDGIISEKSSGTWSLNNDQQSYKYSEVWYTYTDNTTDHCLATKWPVGICDKGSKFIFSEDTATFNGDASEFILTQSNGWVYTFTRK